MGLVAVYVMMGFMTTQLINNAKFVIILVKLVPPDLVTIAISAILLNRGFQIVLVSVYVMMDFMMTLQMNNTQIVIFHAKIVL